MRKITETLRLHFECGRSNRDISSAIGASPTTVCDYLRRVKAAMEGNRHISFWAALGVEMPWGLGDVAINYFGNHKSVLHYFA